MKCQKCNSNIDNDAQFCPYCGHTISHTSSSSARITIGRSPDNDIVLSDPGVSRRHAGVSYERGEYTLEDTGSANGTFVNGYKIQFQRIKSSDSIRLGQNSNLSFRDIEAALTRKSGNTYHQEIKPENPDYSHHPSPTPGKPVYELRNDNYTDDVTVGQWIGNLILTGIPIIGLIILIVWSSDTSQPSRASWAKAVIIFNIIGLVLGALWFISLFSMAL